MLKNVHLAPQWLVQLEKKVHSLTPHANFRLFLTMEITHKVRLVHVYLREALLLIPKLTKLIELIAASNAVG